MHLGLNNSSERCLKNIVFDYKSKTIFFLLIFIFSVSPIEANENHLLKDSKTTESNWEKDAGIRVLSIRKSAAGYMLDFRYKVIDPAKAATFLDRGNKPLLNVLKNGSILRVPVSSKIGPLRQSALLAKVGKSYFMFFANPGRIVKSGDKVQLNIGDVKSKTLIVE